MNRPVTWGKPLVEYGKTAEDDAAPAAFKQMPVIEEGTALLTTVKGSANELYGEGHELIARKMQKSYRQFAMSVFIPSGEEDPIPDDDGVINDEYCVRMTPEDDTLEGFIMRKCSVEVEEEWSSAKGRQLKYIFSSLKPKTGKMIERYTKAVAPGS